MDDYEELQEEYEDELDSNQDIQEGQEDSYGIYPTPKEKSDIYNWFWKVLKIAKPKQMVRAANLDKQEIGDHIISVRDCLNLSKLGHIFGHEKFGDYFSQRAGIVSATSMAKKGWLMELSISQKKVRSRERSSTSYNLIV